MHNSAVIIPPDPSTATGPNLGDATPLLPGAHRLNPSAHLFKTLGRVNFVKLIKVSLVLGSALYCITVVVLSHVRQHDMIAREEAVLAREYAVVHRENDSLAREESLEKRETQLRGNEDAVAAHEGDVRDRDRAVRAKQDAMRADQERRERARLYWNDPVAEQRCLGYEMRKYHAELLNVPEGEDAQKWCMETSISIHGNTYEHPDYCTEERANGTVGPIGHWTVQGNEPTCRTWWGNHEKKECFGSHQQRVEAQLFNHQEPWDNWSEMCFSTPSDFAYQSFAHPDACEHRGGIIGSWFVDVKPNECP